MNSYNASPLYGKKGKTFLDSGYIYAPYVPIQVTPSFLDEKKVPNSPLEDLVNGVYEEEISSGELTPIRRASPADDIYRDLRSRIAKRYGTKLVNPKYFSTVNITNL